MSIDLDSPIVTAALHAYDAVDLSPGPADRLAMAAALNAALAEFRKQQGIPTSILNIGGKA